MCVHISIQKKCRFPSARNSDYVKFNWFMYLYHKFQGGREGSRRYWNSLHTRYHGHTITTWLPEPGSLAKYDGPRGDTSHNCVWNNRNTSSNCDRLSVSNYVRHCCVQTDSSVHPASCPALSMGVKLTTALHTVSKLRMRGAISPVLICRHGVVLN
jgi:hypothetical protein